MKPKRLKSVRRLSEPSYQVDDRIYKRFDESQQVMNVLARENGRQYRAAMAKSYFMNYLAGRTSPKKDIGGRSAARSEIAATAGMDLFNAMVGNEGSGKDNVGYLSYSPLKAIPQFAPGGEIPPDLSDPIRLTRQAKVMARMFGADLVGICRLDRRWVYSSSQRNPESPDPPETKAIVWKDQPLPEETETELVIPESVGYYIVMAIAMPRRIVQSSPSIAAGGAAFLGYSRMAIAVSSLAEYIRTMGYMAIPAMNGTGLSVPMAVDAGLGECARHGLLISPEYGPCIRLCKVLTNMPLVADKPIAFGVENFCGSCRKCARHCPVGCISDGQQSWQGTDVNNPGVRKWYNDYRKCLEFWAKSGNGCINCIAVCPFTKSEAWAYRVPKWFIGNVPALNRTWLALDDFLGFGKERDSREMWTRPTSTYGLSPQGCKEKRKYE